MGIVEKSKARFDYMSVATFSHTILLGCVRRCSVVGNSMSGEERFESDVFTAIVCKKRNNGRLKIIFY